MTELCVIFRQSLKWQGLQPDNVRFTSNGEDLADWIRSQGDTND